MDFELVVAKSVRRMRKVGLGATLREGFQALGGLFHRDLRTNPFDLKYGTDTGGDMSLWNFEITSPNAIFGVKYQATDEQELADAVGYLQEDPHDLTFIDLGCGKGRALLVAANLGFKRVVGVEFAHELAEIARKNVSKMHVVNAIVLEVDSAEYRFPDSEMVVYLYNPFSQEVMHKVVANLRASTSKKLYLIYNTPECGAVFETSGFLTRVGCPPATPHIHVWKAVTVRQ